MTSENESNLRVRLTTTAGVIELELYPDKAPVTVKNFLQYVDSGFYDNTIFHRVIPKFMIQGGGFLPILETGVPFLDPKPAYAPIENEAANGLKNLLGTVAMARTSDPHSATSEFFINTKDNGFLDHRDETPAGWGYAVFGRVVKGMEVVRKIESKRTRKVGPFENVPLKNVIITSARRIDVESAGVSPIPVAPQATTDPAA